MIFGISGCDRIVSKNSLWSVIKEKFGRDKASLMMPETYVLSDKQDMKASEMLHTFFAKSVLMPDP